MNIAGALKRKFSDEALASYWADVYARSWDRWRLDHQESVSRDRMSPAGWSP
jgi:hypothetical protein